jgi:hypothetical protein
LQGVKHYYYCIGVVVTFRELEGLGNFDKMDGFVAFIDMHLVATFIIKLEVSTTQITNYCCCSFDS